MRDYDRRGSGMDVAIVDYSMGNLRSVANALEAVGASPRITTRPDELSRADAIVLPGVGAFADGMRNLKQRGFVEELRTQVVERRKPVLGLCLGMQLLAERGTEHGTVEGLGFVPGDVVRMPSNGVRVPHIGWNDVRFTRTDGLYDGLGEAQDFYFVHSYTLDPADESLASGVCVHGDEFVASIEDGNVFGTQFHPEKSQSSGLTVLRNFMRACSSTV